MPNGFRHVLFPKETWSTQTKIAVQNAVSNIAKSFSGMKVLRSVTKSSASTFNMDFIVVKTLKGGRSIISKALIS